MARARRKTSTRRTQAKGRKAESPEMRSGTDGLNIHTYTQKKFPKAVQDRFVDGYEAAKSAFASGAFKVSGELTTAKRKSARKAVFNHVRTSGSEREQLYLNEPNDPGKAYRAGVRSGVQVIYQEEGSGRSRYGARYNPRRRRWNVSAAQLREFERQGFSPRYVKRVAKIKGRGHAPATMRELEKDHDGNSFWPVITAHGTHWHYTIKKYKPGYVVEFRRRDGKSARHFISRKPSASATKTYYRTKNEAFRSLARHAMKGSYAAFKNPRRRR